VPHFRGGWILITWCLARTVAAVFGLACMRFVGIRCEGPAGATAAALVTRRLHVGTLVLNNDFAIPSKRRGKVRASRR
jgi:transposase